MPQTRKAGRKQTAKAPGKRGTVSGRHRNIPPTTDPAPSGATSSEVEQARQELTGEETMGSAADEPGIMAQPLDARPFSTGNKVENQLPEDDETVERMVQEGVDDAEQDEMDAANKTRTKSEG